jgi:hypothetical protein
MEEGEKLIELWKKNNFMDFNSWVQVARTTLIIDYQANQGYDDKGKVSV